MGSDGEDPASWSVPPGPWHPDFDPAVEVSMLRAFAARLIERHPEYAVRLVVSEPGYMHVEIDVGGARRVAELLVAADSPDGVRWGYAYDLSSPRASGGLELQFGADGIDDAIEELHRFAAGPAH